MTAVVVGGVGGSVDVTDDPTRQLGIVDEPQIDVPLSTIRTALEAVELAIEAVQPRALPAEQIAALTALPANAATDAKLEQIRAHVDTLEELLGRLPDTGAASNAELVAVHNRLAEIRDRIPAGGLAHEETLQEVRDRLPGPAHAMLDKVGAQLRYLGKAPPGTATDAPEWTITKYRYALPTDAEPVEWDAKTGLAWDDRAAADWPF